MCLYKLTNNVKNARIVPKVSNPFEYPGKKLLFITKIENIDLKKKSVDPSSVWQTYNQILLRT
jgi:hypothetical protein